MTMRVSRRALLAAPMVMALPARAQDAYPKAPVKIIVPAAPGGPTDVMARMVQPGLSARLGQPVLIINRAGAGGNIGVVQAAKSPNDGYTLLIASTGFVVNVSLYQGAGLRRLQGLRADHRARLLAQRASWCIRARRIKTVADLIAMAKASKDKLNVINPGQGSTPHLADRAAADQGRHPIENIPYNGAGPAIQAILAKTTPLGTTALPPAHPHIKSGALRALALTGERRWFDLPDVPTMVESGFPDIVSETFQGMYAPAGTPDAIVQRVAAETLAVLKEPEVTAKLRDVGFDVRAAGPKGLAARVAKEVPMWRDIIQQSKIEQQ